jgi:hypothetical protein
MPVLVVDTNSWVSVAEADAYLDELMGADAWDVLDVDIKEKCLISAYRWINRLTNYVISVATNKVKYAQILLAWYIYNYYDTHTKHEALNAQGIKDFRVSKFSETLSGKTDLPQDVKDLLEDYDLYGGGYLPTIEREVVDNE